MTLLAIRIVRQKALTLPEQTRTAVSADPRRYNCLISGLLPPDREDLLHARQPLQLHLASGAELDVSAACRELLQQRRHEDLPARRLTSDSGGQVDVVPKRSTRFTGRG